MTSTTPPTTRHPPRRLGDRLFRGSVTGAGGLIVVILAGVALFLVLKSIPALTAKAADLPGGQTFVHYVWPLVYGTLLSAVLALVVAVPFAVGIALFISHYAPPRLASALGYVTDLLAAVPSVVFGLWGIFWLAPELVTLYTWLAAHLGWLPLFSGPASVTGRTILTASLVLAVMILPIISALSREIFLQAPRSLAEAAYALGATRWEMIRLSVLPYGKAGVVSASMLGLGRALGETMAVALVLSGSGGITADLISSTNPNTIAANIALQFPDSSGLSVNVLIATGLVLFVITFVVNFAARAIVERRPAGERGQHRPKVTT